jgi:hypothetical protein
MVSESTMSDPEAPRDAIDHLQAAALELIDAARGVLDVLEEVVADRDALDGAVELVTDAVASSGIVGRPPQPGGRASPEAARSRGPGPPADGGPPVEPIVIA